EPPVKVLDPEITGVFDRASVPAPEMTLVKVVVLLTDKAVLFVSAARPVNVMLLPVNAMGSNGVPAKVRALVRVTAVLALRTPPLRDTLPVPREALLATVSVTAAGCNETKPVVASEVAAGMATATLPL